MNRHLSGVPALLLALTGCTFSSPGPGPEIRIVEVGEIHLLPTEAHFVAVRDLALVGGSLWVLDGAPPFVTRVSSEGGKAVQFGEEGEGPGEFLDPWAIQPSARPDSHGVRAWDLRANRVSTFDSLGGLVSSERLSDEGRIRARSRIRDVSYGNPFRIRSSGTTIVVGSFPRRIDRTSGLALGSLSLAGDRLEPVASLVRFADHMVGGTSSLREWAAVPFWDVCDGEVVLWSPVSDEVVWMDLQGEVQASAPVDGKKTPLSPEDVEAYLRWMARLELGPRFEEAEVKFPTMANTYRDRFAEYRPRATDLQCQSGRVAWVRLFDTAFDPLGRGQTWLKVTTDGTRLKFTFPEEFTPAVFTDRGAYGLFEAPEGYQQLAFWGVGSTD